MSILVRFTPASNATTDQYDEVIRRLESAGEFPPDGLESHCAFTDPDGNIRVSEVWDSREQFDALAQRLMPVLADVGIEIEEPEMFQVHNIITR